MLLGRLAALSVLAISACGSDGSADGADAEAQDAAEAYCDETLTDGCSSDSTHSECVACHVACGGPCRFNASCPPNGFVCDDP